MVVTIAQVGISVLRDPNFCKLATLRLESSFLLLEAAPRSYRGAAHFPPAIVKPTTLAYNTGVEDNRLRGWLVRAVTVALDSYQEGDDLGVDLVLPLLASKSSRKPATGTRTWDACLGVVVWSEARPQSSCP